MTTSDLKPVPVWDLATRVFHWALAVLIGANLIVGGEDAGFEFQVHVVVGYLIAALVVFRVIWGAIGSPHSRFGDFVFGWRTVVGYARRLLRLDPPHYVGHNPLGGWMIMALLTAITLTVATGLLGRGRRTAGPLSDWVAGPVSSALGEIHGALSNLLILLIALHVAGVVADWLLTGVNLVRAMIVGAKPLSAAEAGNERPLASAWRAVIVALCVATVAAWTFSRTDMTELGKPRPGAIERVRGN